MSDLETVQTWRLKRCDLDDDRTGRIERTELYRKLEYCLAWWPDAREDPEGERAVRCINQLVEGDFLPVERMTYVTEYLTKTRDYYRDLAAKSSEFWMTRENMTRAADHFEATTVLWLDALEGARL